LTGPITPLFYTLDRATPSDRATATRASLTYAVDLYQNPERHSIGEFGVGPRAFENWIAGVRAGHGAEHGAWWNAVVWSENRLRAADYIREISDLLEAPEDVEEIVTELGMVGDILYRCADRTMAAEDKIALLEDAAARDAECFDRIAANLGKFPQ
jgi:hypothetical protein